MARKSKAEYMEMALNVAKESPDPHKKVGCVAISSTGRVVGFGYNNILDVKKAEHWWKNRDDRRKFMVHAETNLLRLLKASDAEDVDTIYITLFPCVHCMTQLATFGVRRIVYLEIYDKDIPATEVAEFYNIRYSPYTDA